MGVKLEWQIEAERENQRGAEDPAAQIRRRRQRWRIILFTAFVVAVVGGTASAIGLRLVTVDNNLRTGLVDAAKAEVTALRIGDQNSFMALMESKSTDWIDEQRVRFKRYQGLKAKAAIQFTGNILDATVDGERGRVQIEEIVNGVPSEAIWFFWRYTHGWRHVPADLTFWGDPAQINGAASTVKYDSVDAALATSVAKDVEHWWANGCALVGCSRPPHLTVEIVPDPSLVPQWADKADGSAPDLMLRIGSPLTQGDRAPLSPALPADLETTIATRLAEKLFDLASAQLPINADSDVFWLRQSIVDWTAASLLGHGSTARIGFIQSIADHNGNAGVTKIIRGLSTNSDIGAVATALNTSLDALTVDWSPFFQWRLELEKLLVASRKKAAYDALWDQTLAANTALSHWSKPSTSLPQVQQVTLGQDPTRGIVAVVTMIIDGAPARAQYHIVAGDWKRIE